MTVTTTLTPSSRPLSELASIAADFAARPRDWIERVQLRVGERWYERLERSDSHEVWAISWLPGQSTGFHDHGGSAGAFAVVFGTLQEHRPGTPPLDVSQSQVRAFGPHDVHDVRNASSAPAVSIHAYSPPLSTMNRYELAGAGLIPRGTVFEDIEGAGEDSQATETAARTGAASTAKPGSVDEVMALARARLRRVSPAQAHEAIGEGAVLVDIRPAAQRAREGEIPGAWLVERNVLEWRFDPASDARLPIATGHDLLLIIVCSEGYASSLAAASMQDIGLVRATDMIGGFHAWRAAGLPTIPATLSQ